MVKTDKNRVLFRNNIAIAPLPSLNVLAYTVYFLGIHFKRFPYILVVKWKNYLRMIKLYSSLLLARQQQYRFSMLFSSVAAPTFSLPWNANVYIFAKLLSLRVLLCVIVY